MTSEFGRLANDKRVTCMRARVQAYVDERANRNEGKACVFR